MLPMLVALLLGQLFTHAQAAISNEIKAFLFTHGSSRVEGSLHTQSTVDNKKKKMENKTKS